MRQRRCSNITNDVILSDNKRYMSLIYLLNGMRCLGDNPFSKVKASYRHDIESAISAQVLNEAHFVFRIKF